MLSPMIYKGVSHFIVHCFFKGIIVMSHHLLFVRLLIISSAMFFCTFSFQPFHQRVFFTAFFICVYSLVFIGCSLVAFCCLKVQWFWNFVDFRFQIDIEDFMKILMVFICNSELQPRQSNFLSCDNPMIRNFPNFRMDYCKVNHVFDCFVIIFFMIFSFFSSIFQDRSHSSFKHHWKNWVMYIKELAKSFCLYDTPWTKVFFSPSRQMVSKRENCHFAYMTH